MLMSMPLNSPNHSKACSFAGKNKTREDKQNKTKQDTTLPGLVFSDVDGNL
jgi:hypothetical protein